LVSGSGRISSNLDAVYGATLGEQITDRMRRVWNQAFLGNLGTLSPQSTRRKLGLGLHSVFLLVLFYMLFYPVFSELGIGWLLLPKDAHIGFYRYTAQPIRILISIYLFVYLIPEALVYRLRTFALYQWLLRTIKLKLAPAIFAALSVWYVFALTSHYLFDLRDGFGSFCIDKPSPKILEVCPSGQPPTTSCGMQLDFDFSLPSSLPKDERLCQPAGIQLERGKTYLVLVQRDASNDGWTFWGETSHIYGQSVADLPKWKRLVMVLLYPLHRSLDRPWASVIARFGSMGNEESFMDPAPVRKPPEDLGEVMTPKRDGQLFFYLNKPVIGFWGLERVVANLLGNESKAHITVRRTGS
jgi:hypothetical protein